LKQVRENSRLKMCQLRWVWRLYLVHYANSG
jgi:hypothetical protein